MCINVYNIYKKYLIYNVFINFVLVLFFYLTRFFILTKDWKHLTWIYDFLISFIYYSPIVNILIIINSRRRMVWCPQLSNRH